MALLLERAEVVYHTCLWADSALNHNPGCVVGAVVALVVLRLSAETLADIVYLMVSEGVEVVVILSKLVSWVG